MPTRPKRSRDPVKAAHQVYLEIIGEAPRTLPPTPDDSPAAVAKRKGAAQGGKKRAKGLTPARRREIARKAAAARWEKEANKIGHFWPLTRAPKTTTTAATIKNGLSAGSS